MAEIIISVNNRINLYNRVDFTVGMIIPFYGSLFEADNYFSYQLKADVWNESTQQNKLKALISATQIIDSLSYKYDKTNADQVLQFPRNGYTTVPQSVIRATYEIALKLLEEIDPDKNLEDARIQVAEFDKVRTRYDTQIKLGHIAAGIPSPIAYTLLLSHLNDPNVLKLYKV